MNNQLYLGMSGHVVCINKRDGSEVWRTKIKGGQLTNVVVDGELVFAYSGGHLFCLSAADGRVHWENPLRGLGYGHCILAARGSQDAAMAASRVEDQAAAVIAAEAAAAADGGADGGS